VVLAREVLGEHPDRGRAQGARAEHLEDDRITPHRARGLDAVERGVLRQVEHLPAVGEGGRKAGLGVEAARLELAEVDDERHRGLPLAGSEAGQRPDQVGVREMRDVSDTHDRS
jgi:hypothetical protein